MAMLVDVLQDCRDPDIWFMAREVEAAKKYYRIYSVDQRPRRLTEEEKAYNKQLAKCKTIEEVATLYNDFHKGTGLHLRIIGN